MTTDTVFSATRAYEAIKARIIDCRYAPGTKLSEARLVTELGVGRSPVRTAVARLRSEGWVEVSPQSGSYVKRLSRQEMQEIFDFRVLLETHAARVAATNITAEQLRLLRSRLRALSLIDSDVVDDITLQEFNEFDSLVHATIYQAGGNSLVGQVLQNLLEKAQWMKKATPSTPKRLKTLATELRRIVEALEKRDPELAARRVREHIGQAADFEMKFAA